MAYGTMSTMIKKDLKMRPFKYMKKQSLNNSSAENQLSRAEILLSRIEGGTLPNLVFSKEKKFATQHHFNNQNDRVWSRDSAVEPLVVSRKPGAASVMVWAAVSES